MMLAPIHAPAIHVIGIWLAAERAEKGEMRPGAKPHTPRGLDIWSLAYKAYGPASVKKMGLDPLHG